jgi:hypothetical protein
LQLGAFSQLARDSINCFVSVVFKLEAAAPLEERREFPANQLVLLGCPVAVGIKLREQSGEGFFS